MGRAHLVLSVWWRQLPALTAARRTPGPHAQGFCFVLFQTFHHLANLQAGQVTGTVPEARPESPTLPCESLILFFMEGGINHQAKQAMCVCRDVCIPNLNVNLAKHPPLSKH